MAYIIKRTSQWDHGQETKYPEITVNTMQEVIEFVDQELDNTALVYVGDTPIAYFKFTSLVGWEELDVSHYIDDNVNYSDDEFEFICIVDDSDLSNPNTISYDDAILLYNNSLAFVEKLKPENYNMMIKHHETGIVISNSQK